MKYGKRAVQSNCLALTMSKNEENLVYLHTMENNNKNKPAMYIRREYCLLSPLDGVFVESNLNF